ncbi:hypothetical protein ACFWNK_01995 [Streptomyces sp. NPDC058417]|uniref:hypothetical protein n=1 Tax=unclassified Streptomyces TaxID=2593676 RepID=UPI00365E6A34
MTIRRPRILPRPTGHHRRTQPAPTPVEALVSDVAWCPVEEATRLHAFLATGGRVCWTCRTITGTAVAGDRR